MGIDRADAIFRNVVEKLMNETQKTPALVVFRTLQLADTLVVKKKNGILPGAEEGYLENRREERRKLL